VANWAIGYNATVPQISLQLPDSSYLVTVEPGLISRCGEKLAALNHATKAAIVTDEHAGSHHLARLVDSLRKSGIEPIVAILTPGEDHKTLQALLPVFDQFLHAKIERTTPVIAFGGGLVGDMAGFVAATILRGVPFVQIPTTLLAMVDASIGGKTGVNSSMGKNLIGAFHQPIAVFADPEVLRTLPKREFVSGLAECIKHEIIRDAEGFAALEKNIDAILRLEMNLLTEFIAHNVQIKAKVVEADPREHGERAHLNFGHTFGHAIEKVSKFSYTHGESIALGMVAATNLAVELKMLDAGSKDRIVSLIGAAGLPVSRMKLATKDVYEAMTFDKKVKSARIRLILPDRIGHVVIRDDVPQDAALKAIESLR
jgi:3-dehydroquinate synthase